MFSCSNVCTVIGTSELSNTVSDSGSYTPDSTLSSVLGKNPLSSSSLVVTTSTFTVPLDSILAIVVTRLLEDPEATNCNAFFISPFLSRVITSVGMSLVSS